MKKNRIGLDKVSKNLETVDSWLQEYVHELKKLMLSGTQGSVVIEIVITDGGGMPNDPYITTKRKPAHGG